MIEAEVRGIPATQGSKWLVRGRMIDVKQSDLRAWRDVVAITVRAAYRGRPLTAPVSVRLDFFLPRPKKHFGTGRNSHVLKESAPALPQGKPDIDKLCRAVLDALTGVAFKDDSQVAMLFATKNYVLNGSDPGVSIRVRPALMTDQQ